MELKKMNCVPITGKEPPLTSGETAEYQKQAPDWTISEKSGEKQLAREFRFGDFASALAFTQKVGALAEAQDHHPAILTEWGRVTVAWWTHKIHGLHQNDFIMAAKTDDLYAKAKMELAAQKSPPRD